MSVDSPASSSYSSDVVQLVKVTWPLFLGNMLEWYEFGVYGFVEDELAANFFGGSQLGGWLGYSITFVARPAGGFLIGWIADRWGRKLAVNLSLGGMILATVGQGLLPGAYLGSGYEDFGLALLIVCRALQGLSAGGEIGAVSCWLMEVSPLATLGMAVSLISVGSQVAWAFVTCFLAMLTSLVGPESMLVWGWRVPFVIALLPGAVALWGRNGMEEVGHESGKGPGPEDAERGAGGAGRREGEADPEPGCCRPLAGHWPNVLIGFFSTVAIATMWYVATVWPVTAILSESLGADSLWVGCMVQLVGLAVTPVAGWLTDECGVGFVTFAGAGFFALMGLPVYTWIYSDPTFVPAAFLGVGLFYGLAQGFAGATIFLFAGELFPAGIRCTGIAASYNIAVSLVGGFGSSFCQALLSVAPSYGPGLYLSATGLVSALAVLLAMCLQRRGLVRLTHRRLAPYFGPAVLKGF